jgi:UrcA family protein
MKAININTRSFVRRCVAVAICGSFALGLATTASASDERSITVKFADLDVASPQGAAELYGRIDKAARTVCALTGWPGIYPSQFNNCVHKSITDAVTKVNQQALYTVYNEHNKTPLTPALLSQTR